MAEKERGIRHIIKELFEDLADNIVEERVINYVVRELHVGRNMSAILEDPYVVNRLNKEKIKHIQENPHILQTVEEELSKAFKTRDFKFK